MSDEEFVKEMVKKHEDGIAAHEKFMQEKIPVRVKLILEGFKSDQGGYTISPELTIRKASLEEREQFFSRASTLLSSPSLSQDNEFFVEFDYDTSRNSLTGSEGTNLVACFFAVSGKLPFNINKGQLYALNKTEPTSLGIHMMPYEMKNPPRVLYSQENFEQLKVLWPIFKKLFQDNAWFALVGRRFFYSTLKFSWEDRLLDLFIALEALLIVEKDREKKVKLAERATELLKLENCTNVHEVITGCYDIRNDIIHGNIPEVKDLPDEMVSQLSIIVKSSIQVYMKNYAGLSPKQLISRLRNSNVS